MSLPRMGVFIVPAQPPGSSEWTPPADWPVLAPGDNEIEILVCDLYLATIAFAVTTTAAQYQVNWGDGNTELFDSSNTAQHTYEIGTGQSCTRGYTTFKITISSESNITSFTCKDNNLQDIEQICPVLYAKFGTTQLTDLSLAFGYGD